MSLADKLQELLDIKNAVSEEELKKYINQKLDNDISDYMQENYTGVTTTSTHDPFSPFPKPEYTWKKITEVATHPKSYKLPNPKKKEIHNGVCYIEKDATAILLITKQGNVIKITENKIEVDIKNPFVYQNRYEVIHYGNN